MEAETGCIRSLELVAEGALPAARTLLREALADTRPHQVLVDDAALAAGLRELEPTWPVTYRRVLPTLEEVYEGLLKARGCRYLEAGMLQPEHVGELAAATVRFLDDRPFERIGDHDVVVLEGLFHSPIYAVLSGADSWDCGLALFLSGEALDAFRRQDESECHPALYLTTEPHSRAMEEEFTEHDWPVHALGYPLLARSDRAALEPEDLEVTLIAIEGVRQFLARGGACRCEVRGRSVEVRWEGVPSAWKRMMQAVLEESSTPPPVSARRQTARRD